ncbi:putative protein OS=Tsukamurella paurometabola (strain ATCC 8368 / DSM / CCUG 35730 /CIP 100753 / JCM 10117 / KCTC 9821 / NBRC 16120 / NCIMB 702349/ NCTC 13040) OX=521096 GN=Tpau_3487 PE=4 SV=1 [Tsukamurella paurometabola]|uniref:Uncharacterized protein n=1 Tax=Tsukamurella paurometabola (strain ATCC 8368 / DSM 20162 / CCUG 35730 / CIP 100753 / JCM 10117 / KCTC 9821 / NBRC 16120 / NCIMB 702349 / NCTC 13040) TaxID=521096 RepID=D5UX47_TSUPD|nr:activator-dependent family glycosyltransferase [Tsukamurella paurometabola]ADG80066.1 protein of unknown function DUF1205 [Tsukamurella paurometabola DSM 20162]SUP38288.1 Glycosyl transferases, related to UDP-glucuronosyltransferase [Tsukamurella paurometabola]
MKILFVPSAEPSHVVAMATTAWAACVAGHDVRVAASPAVVDTVVGAGLTAVEVGADHGMGEILQTHGAAIENEIADWSEPFIDRQDWESVLIKYQVAIPYGLALYAEPVLDDLVAFARSWQPDLVVWDQLAYAGPVAARACGAAHARLLWMVDVYSSMRETFLALAAQQPSTRTEDPLREWITGLLSRYGLDFDDAVLTGDVTIDQIPPSIQLPSDTDRVMMRYVPYNGRSVIPNWLLSPPERPRVCITGSTSFGTDTGGGFLPFSECLAALADIDAEVVVTLGRTDRSEIGPVPANVRVVDFAPFSALLPTCAAVIHHGGFGTWATAASSGVPQLIIPIRHGDLWIRGERTAAVGAAVNRHPSALTAADLRESVTRLIDPDGDHRRAAVALADEIAGLPAPAAVAERFGSLVETAV